MFTFLVLKFDFFRSNTNIFSSKQLHPVAESLACKNTVKDTSDKIDSIRDQHASDWHALSQNVSPKLKLRQSPAASIGTEETGNNVIDPSRLLLRMQFEAKN